MPFAVAMSQASDTTRALEEVCSQALQQLEVAPELALVFFSPHHAADAEEIATTLHRRVQARCLLGCTGESIVGNDLEVEQRPAISLWLGNWGGKAELAPFHLVLEQTTDGISLLGWPDDLDGVDPKQAAMLVLGDPFTFYADLFLQLANDDYPGLRVVGGMSSGGHMPGENRLILNGEVRTEGAVGVLIQGEVALRTVVSQGCRPIGRHMVVTKGQDNIIAELGGRAPLGQLQELWKELSAEDQKLFQQGLHIGRVINEYKGDFQRGEFLVRNVLGLDRESGSLAITDRVRVGQTVQFHVRDAATADEDLHALLRQDLQSHPQKPQAALLFTCNGRGNRLFPQPHHDTRVVREEAGPLPVAGFFAQGELGPVGGQNFIHGFTASVVLFE